MRLSTTGWEPRHPGVSSAAEVSAMINQGCSQALKATLLAVVQWRTDCEKLQVLYPELPPLQQLLHRLEIPRGRSPPCATTGGQATGGQALGMRKNGDAMRRTIASNGTTTLKTTAKKAEKGVGTRGTDCALRSGRCKKSSGRVTCGRCHR